MVKSQADESGRRMSIPSLVDPASLVDVVFRLW